MKVSLTTLAHFWLTFGDVLGAVVNDPTSGYDELHVHVSTPCCTGLIIPSLRASIITSFFCLLWFGIAKSSMTSSKTVCASGMLQSVEKGLHGDFLEIKLRVKIEELQSCSANENLMKT